MQELFKITETYDVELNKEWMLLIPEFKAIIHADKGSPGDNDGRKKLKARKQFGYIYFMVDFKSPLSEWEFSQRHAESLKYVDLTEKDVSNALIKAAYDRYDELQHMAARALRTLQSAKKAVDALDAYYESLDFTLLDKQGKLVNNPKEIAASIAGLNKMYDDLDKFEKRVREELKESTTIRGQASLGDKEHKRTGKEVWSEGSAEEINSAAPLFTDMIVELNSIKEPPKEDEPI